MQKMYFLVSPSVSYVFQFHLFEQIKMCQQGTGD